MKRVHTPITIDKNVGKKIESSIISWLRENLFPIFNKTVNLNGFVKSTLVNERKVDIYSLMDKGIVFISGGVLRIKRPTPAYISKYLRDNFKVLWDEILGADPRIIAYAENIRSQSVRKVEEYMGAFSQAMVDVGEKSLIEPGVVYVEEYVKEKVLDSTGEEVQFITSDRRTHYIQSIYESLQLAGTKDWRKVAFEILDNKGFKAFEKYIQTKYAGTGMEQRVSFIVKNETSRYTASCVRESQLQQGHEFYIWTTKNDDKVRPDHQRLEGVICSWYDPPIIDTRTELRGHPGEAWNCRCSAAPYF